LTQEKENDDIFTPERQPFKTQNHENYVNNVGNFGLETTWKKSQSQAKLKYINPNVHSMLHFTPC